MNIAAFLDKSELEHLTGYKTNARQIKQLKIQGIPYYINGLGKPVVPRASLGQSTEEVTPDFSQINA